MPLLKTVFIITITMLLVACQCENIENEMNRNEIKLTVEKEFNNLIQAAMILDMELILTYYSNNVSAIENGLMHKTSDDFFNSYRNAVASVLEFHKVDILNPRINVVSSDVVILEAKLDQDVTLKSGDRIKVINSLTLVYKLDNGKWKIIHHHGS